MDNTNVNDVSSLLASPELPEVVTPIEEEPQPEQQGIDPYKLIESLGGPNKDTLERLKSQIPGGRLRIVSPDMQKRVYVLRGLSGLEWSDARKRVPQNSSDPDNDFAINAAIKACVWTSTTRGNKLDETTLRTGTAGMPSTLFGIVALLSDFVEPVAFAQISAEL